MPNMLASGSAFYFAQYFLSETLSRGQIQGPTCQTLVLPGEGPACSVNSRAQSHPRPATSWPLASLSAGGGEWLACVSWTSQGLETLLGGSAFLQGLTPHCRVPVPGAALLPSRVARSFGVCSPTELLLSHFTGEL